jgi:regulator of nonsense transcripts 1
MDQFRRHETSARDLLSSGGFMSDGILYLFMCGISLTQLTGRRSGTPSRFDASFYRTHDALGYIPSDVQSLRSQATYSSGLPMFAATGPFGAAMPRGGNGGKRSAYGSYASSIISQDAGPSGSVTDNSSVIGASERASSSMAYSQSDRLRRRASFSNSSVAGTSDLGSISQYDYKSQDDAADMDDMKSQYAGTQAGVTVF